jgi:2-C-methyl-D-erythritol 4-phosphate cytidylyltransferase
VLRTLRVFEACPEIDSILPVLPSEHMEIFQDMIKSAGGFTKISNLVAGGEQRQDSVYNGLSRLDPGVDLVVVHDGVRPFVTPNLIRSCIEAARRQGAAVAALPVQETVKLTDAQGWVRETLPRDMIYLAQTPQVFRREILAEAFLRAKEEGYYGTDEASLVERMGIGVKLVAGERWNIKITTPEDLVWAQVYSESMVKGAMVVGGMQ